MELLSSNHIYIGAAFGTVGAIWLLRKMIQGRGTHRRATSPLRVVITGSTRGLGLEMAREFLSVGDNVIVTSRKLERAISIAKMLSDEFPGTTVVGAACDVADMEQVDKLAVQAINHFKGIDVWINNAGISIDPKKPVHECSEKTLRSVIDTNTMGTLFGCRAAIRTLIEQKKRDNKAGHVFNMDGAGSNGMATPNFAIYGASKALLPQLMKSLVKETKSYGIGIHTLSPGMMITDLLLNGSKDKKTLKIFNILAVLPETSAAWLVPRVRKTALSKGFSTGRYYKFLTFWSVLWKFATSCFRKKYN